MVWHGPWREFEPFFEEPCALPPEERTNVFTASVGNLLPGQELTVELTWVEAPVRADDAIRFALPTVVAPPLQPPDHDHGVDGVGAEDGVVEVLRRAAGLCTSLDKCA